MNLVYREKFKNILKIEQLGNTLKGEELLITVQGNKKIKTFGNVKCLVINRIGEEAEISGKELTVDHALKLDQFMDQL